MNTIKKYIIEWERLVKRYDDDAKEIQKKIAAVLKKDWDPENPGAITEAQMKQILEKSGRLYHINLKFEILPRTIFNESRG